LSGSSAEKWSVRGGEQKPSFLPKIWAQKIDTSGVYFLCLFFFFPNILANLFEIQQKIVNNHTKLLVNFG
jgi:hypothetical protein